jgi:DNA-binding NarL/FixJ family response regulator
MVPGILLADEQTLFRDCLTALIRRERPSWKIVGELSGGSDLERSVRETRPDVVILDLTIPEGGGFHLLRRIGAMNPAVRTVVLSSYGGADLARKCRRAGARGYILRSDSSATLIGAVEIVLQGRTFFSHSAPAGSSDYALGSGPERPVRLRLTTREFDVFRELALGRANKVIAGDLGVSIRTVESHRARIQAKLGIAGIGELVTIAIRERLA